MILTIKSQLSKKDHLKKKPHPEDGHFEGKYWCECKTRNRRKWLGYKRGISYDQLDNYYP